MKRTWRWPFAGFVVGAVAGATILTVNVVGASTPERPPGGAERFGEILHTPVLLARVGSPVALTYDFVCGVPRHEPGGGCSPQGSVFVRPAGESEFTEVPLQRDESGMLRATVDPPEAGQGFDYYAEIDNGRGQSATLPAGAGGAPHHVWPLESPTEIALGAEPFGSTRAPGSIAATFAWGRGTQAVGLDSGREQARIGPSAFDVARDGSIVVLDQVNRRLTAVRSGERPQHMPIQFTGGEGDLAVGRDGKIYVLDAARPPLVRSFTADGYPLAGTRLAEAAADMVRAGPDGPLVHAYPSEMWLPTGAGRPPLSPSEQLAAAEPARRVEGGASVVVRASPAELEVALVRGGRVAHAWVVHGATSFGEVQLAEPFGNGLLVVVRLWTEKQAQFRVLRLTPAGVGESFAVDRAEWAETASLSRFRLHGNTLYQLRSTPAGAEIATFEIGGKP
jgi:hypothetical protein